MEDLEGEVALVAEADGAAVEGNGDERVKHRRRRPLLVLQGYRATESSLARGQELYPPVVERSDGTQRSYEEYLELGLKPSTLVECQRAGMGGPGRPCPFVSCRRHLAVEDRGANLYIHSPVSYDEDDPVPSLDIESLPFTCSAEQQKMATGIEAYDPLDGMTLETIGELMGVTRERIRQIEASALAKLRVILGDQDWSALFRDHANDGDEVLVGSVWMKKSSRTKTLWQVTSISSGGVITICPISRGKDFRLTEESLRHGYAQVHDGLSREAAKLLVERVESRGKQRITSSVTPREIADVCREEPEDDGEEGMEE